MFNHFRPFYQAFDSGSGRVNRWLYQTADVSTIAPKYLISRESASKLSKNHDKLRFAFRDICRNTDERTFIGSIIPPFPSGNTVPSLAACDDDTGALLFLSSACSTLVCDYLARLRTSGAHINQFILKDIQIPRQEDGVAARRLRLATARLTFTHSCFAAVWLRLRSNFPCLDQREWKYWWAISEADRMRLRVEIEAICAGLYGLDPDDFSRIVREDPSDSKGFYRVDRQLPFRQRLTGLAAAAFRALKEGKWSAETACSLTNDEFFEILGIPELTERPSCPRQRAARSPDHQARRLPRLEAREFPQR